MLGGPTGRRLPDAAIANQYIQYEQMSSCKPNPIQCCCAIVDVTNNCV